MGPYYTLTHRTVRGDLEFRIFTNLCEMWGFLGDTKCVYGPMPEYGFNLHPDR